MPKKDLKQTYLDAKKQILMVKQELLDDIRTRHHEPSRYTITQWYDNGNKKEECSYLDRMKHGFERKWYYNGQLSSEESYFYDMQHGDVTRYYPEGPLNTESYCKLGKQNGLYRSYKLDGTVINEILFKDNVGVYQKSWSRDGYLEYEQNPKTHITVFKPKEF